MDADSLEQVQEIQRLSAGITHALECRKPEVVRDMVRTLNNELAAVAGAILFNAEQDGAEAA